MAATFVTLALSYGVWYAYAVFLVALVRDFGWSRSVVAGAFSLFTLVHGLASYPIGWCSDRFGPRRLVLAGGVLLAAGLLLDSIVSSPWQLYLSYGILTAVGVAAAGWVPAVLLVRGWYPQRVGTMLGLTSAGIGVGISLFVPLCQWLIDLGGWRGAFRVVAAVTLLWIVPATLWLVRNPVGYMGGLDGSPKPPGRSSRPGEAGARLESAMRAAAPARPLGGAPEPTLRIALAGRQFWLLAATTLTTSFVNQMLLVHQVAYLVDHGITTFVAASVVSVVGVGSILSKGAGGWASDTFGREATYTFGMVMVMASIGSLGIVALAPSPAWAYLYGLLVGVGYSVTAPLMPAVISDVYRGRHFGAIFGAIHIANAVGGSSGPWVAGRIFDVTGGYRLAFSLALLAAVAAVAALWTAAPRRGAASGA